MSSDLFEFAQKNVSTQSFRSGPLAFRMRPSVFEEWFGHENILAQGKPLRRWIESDRIPSLILWGPSGCGKTSLAQVIARRTKCRFKAMSAVLSGIKEVKEELTQSKVVLETYVRKTILFLDEIHRFNKAQQDALLPHVEEGSVILIGATTENPAFSINSALLSRLRVIRLERLSEEALRKTVTRALEDPERGLGGFLRLSPEALDWLVSDSDGDARRALTALESVALMTPKTQVPLSIEELKAALASGLSRQPLQYDRKGDEHYQVISALIKSVRDSDVDAAIYYLARLVESGEDPLFISRRLIILASEDIGHADPQALSLAVATQQAVHFLGMPEARIPLAQAVTYLALAPKSNRSYLALERALEEVRQTGALPVPLHLRNAPHPLLRNLGYGHNYRYVHSDTQAQFEQKHLPEGLKNKQFFSRD